jgi:hypothetical protein
MPTRADIRAELNFLSDVLSTRVRTIAAGVLAFAWAFLVEGSTDPNGGLIGAAQLLGPIVLALLALTADLAQYICGYWLNLAMLRGMDIEESAQVDFDTRNFFYRARLWMFSAKILLSIAGTVWLMVVVGVELVQMLLAP